MVFLNSPCRETPKNVLKKRQEKKCQMVGGWVWDLANARGVRRFFFCRPLGYYIDKQGPRAHVESAFAVPRSRAR
jgi:hypothetical protein